MGAEKNIILSLNAIEGVTEAHGTFGLYDILAKVESEDEREIQKIVTEKIRKMSEIHSTMTLTRSESEELFKPSDKAADSTSTVSYTHLTLPTKA